MSANGELRDLEDLLDRIEQAIDGNRVSLDEIMDVIGHRSFGPVLLLAGLVMLAPIIGDIPGVPTLMAIVVIMTAGQVLFFREHLWLPHWILERSVERDKLCKVLDWTRKPARWIDKVLRPRLTILTRRTGLYLVALVSVAVCAVVPAMEFIPFSANLAGLVLTAFGLALIAHDGLVAAVAFALTGGTIAFVAQKLIGG